MVLGYITKSVSPARGRLRQEGRFRSEEVSLSYNVRPCPKTKRAITTIKIQKFLYAGLLSFNRDVTYSKASETKEEERPGGRGAGKTHSPVGGGDQRVPVLII